MMGQQQQQQPEPLCPPAGRAHRSVGATHLRAHRVAITPYTSHRCRRPGPIAEGVRGTFSGGEGAVDPSRAVPPSADVAPAGQQLPRSVIRPRAPGRGRARGLMAAAPRAMAREWRAAAPSSSARETALSTSLLIVARNLSVGRRDTACGDALHGADDHAGGHQDLIARPGATSLASFDGGPRHQGPRSAVRRGSAPGLRQRSLQKPSLQKMWAANGRAARQSHKAPSVRLRAFSPLHLLALESMGHRPRRGVDNSLRRFVRGASACLGGAWDAVPAWTVRAAHPEKNGLSACMFYCYPRHRQY